MRHYGLWFGQLLLVLVLLGGILPSCSKKSDVVVAAYKDQQLTMGELARHLPSDMPSSDSARLVRAYITRWVKEQILLNRALDSIPDLDSRIQFPLADYRRKLAQLEMENHFLAIYLDTLVTLDQMAQYQRLHQQDYLAKDYYYQYRYLKVTQKDVVPLIRNAIGSEKPSALTELKTWAETYAKTQKLDTLWADARKLQEIQAQGAKGLAPLANLRPGGAPIQFPDRNEGQALLHFFYLHRVIRPGMSLPINIVADRLYESILAERRYRLLQQYDNQLAQEADASRDVQIY